MNFFENIAKLKYLKTALRKQHCIHEKKLIEYIYRMLAIFQFSTIYLNSRLLSKYVELKIYQTV